MLTETTKLRRLNKAFGTLALTLPASFAEAVDAKEGDTMVFKLSEEGVLTLETLRSILKRARVRRQNEPNGYDGRPQ